MPRLCPTLELQRGGSISLPPPFNSWHSLAFLGEKMGYFYSPAPSLPAWKPWGHLFEANKTAPGLSQRELLKEGRPGPARQEELPFPAAPELPDSSPPGLTSLSDVLGFCNKTARPLVLPLAWTRGKSRPKDLELAVAGSPHGSNKALPRTWPPFAFTNFPTRNRSPELQQLCQTQESSLQPTMCLSFLQMPLVCPLASTAPYPLCPERNRPAIIPGKAQQRPRLFFYS